MSRPSDAWRNRAACRDERDFTDQPRTDQLAVCLNLCPVRLDCLAYAIRTEADAMPADIAKHPIYGGTTGTERAALRLGSGAK